MAPPTLTITNDQARASVLRAQGFGDPTLTRPIDVLDRLGVIQLDSVNVLARTQEIVPFSRIGPHALQDMTRALYGERRGFEYWGHAASWLPVDLYPFFLWRMHGYRDRDRSWFAAGLREEHGPLYEQILARIRDEGPLTSAAFEDPEKQRGTWWDWKPAKRVLEDLFASGQLTTTNRTTGFGPLYDLPERVIPGHASLEDPGRPAALTHLTRRAVQALGVATAKDLAGYYRTDVAGPLAALKTLIGEGAVVPVEVEGWPAAYADPTRSAGPLTIPTHRADLKLDRPQKTIIVRALYVERPRLSRKPVAAAVRTLAAHLGAHTTLIERAEPDSYRAALE